MERTMSTEQFDSKIMKKNVSTKESVQQQNDILADICTSFSGIKQETVVFEGLLKESVNVLKKVKKKVDQVEDNLLSFENSMKIELDRIVEAEKCEAAMKETISDEQFDFKDMQKNISTKETARLLSDLLEYACKGLSFLKEEITSSQELTKKSVNVLKKVKEQVDQTENKLLTIESSIKKKPDHFVEAEICEAALEEMSVEKYDSQVMQKNVANKETVQQQNNVLVDLRSDFEGIRQKITILEDFLEKFDKALQNIEERIGLDENNLSTLVDVFKERLEQLIVDGYSKTVETKSPVKVINRPKTLGLKLFK